jgi:predicted peroxiredoxin
MMNDHPLRGVSPTLQLHPTWRSPCFSSLPASTGSAKARLNPLDPTMNDMIGNFLAGGGRILVCPPCAKVRGYAEDSLIDGVIIAGAPVMLEEMKAGAGALTF